MQENIPTGTVIFLFTDIEGSTSLWQRYPQDMPAALERHHAILRAAIEQHQGYVFQIIGDAFCAAFAFATDGLAAAMDAQHRLLNVPWGDTGPLRVRMALHAGPAEARRGEWTSGEYLSSLTLSRAARLLSAGHGGQILLSQAVVELASPELPLDASLRDLGEHRLKDLQRPEHIYQLVAADLPNNFPSLKTLDEFPNNLPIQLNRFIGRDHELAETHKLLESHRLLTLVGPGGVGKTRLALHLGADCFPLFPEGVWFVDLASLTDPDLVIPALAAMLGLREIPGIAVLSLLTDTLRTRQLLLILDNCEHVIESCARLADHLLSIGAKLKILATSREVLDVPGEVVFHVPPLSMPTTGDISLKSLSQFKAVQLFIDRATAAQPDFRLNERNASAIQRICQSLDGLPLAIELAASRIRLFTPDQIAGRLDDRFHLLARGSRTAAPRQQTLRALIDWSYDLLPDQERALFRRLSVFAGGWYDQAAEGLFNDPDLIDLLAQLVNKSLVVVEPNESVNRYRFLETIRQYAREKLVEADEMEVWRRRHLDFYLTFVEEVEPKLQGPDMLYWLDRLEAEQENLRAALEWALQDSPEIALRMAAALSIYWSRRGSVSEGLNWVRAALYKTGAVPELKDEAGRKAAAARAKALAAHACLAFDHGNLQECKDAAEAGISLARTSEATRPLALALAIGAKGISLMGDILLARSWGEEGFMLGLREGYLYEMGLALSALFLSADTGYLASLKSLESVALPRLRQSGETWVLALNIADSALVAEIIGDLSSVQSGFEESFRLFSNLHDRQYANASRSLLGHMLRRNGRFQEASEIYRETILIWQELGHLAAVAHQLECFAFIAAALGNRSLSVRLLGAAQEIRNASRSTMSSSEQQEYLQVVSELTGALGQTEFDRLLQEGRGISLEEAIALAVGEHWP